MQERSHQVNMMSQIYRDCDYVLVWLGGRSLKFCKAADRLDRRSVHGRLDTLTRRSHSPLAAIPSDSYFTRLWVIQEILLAREARVVCRGSFEIVTLDWETFRKYLPRLQRRREISAAKKLLLAEQGLTHYRDLRWLLVSFSGSAVCSDPRDCVYGLIGLARREDRITVDYKKTWHDVFIDVVKHLYGTTRSDSELEYNITALLSLAKGLILYPEDWSLVGTREFLLSVFGDWRNGMSCGYESVAKGFLGSPKSPVSSASGKDDFEVIRWWLKPNGKEKVLFRLRGRWRNHPWVRRK